MLNLAFCHTMLKLQKSEKSVSAISPHITRIKAHLYEAQNKVLYRYKKLTDSPTKFGQI